MFYSLNQVAMITGLTTRTLRNYLRQGLLQGEKEEGVWRFTEEDVNALLTDPSARKAMAAHRHALVWDFLSDTYKKTNRSCVVLDFPVGKEEAAQISAFFCRAVTEMGRDVEMRCGQERDITRVILSGAEESVADILRAYYER